MIYNRDSSMYFMAADAKQSQKIPLENGRYRDTRRVSQKYVILMSVAAADETCIAMATPNETQFNYIPR